MGWLFRKSFKILPGIRLNLGKKGITSATIAKGGWFSTNVNKKGVRHNLTAPGTGLTYQTKRIGSLTGTPATGQPYRYQSLNNTLTTTWHCDTCGNLNSPGNKFCGNCGQSGMEVVRMMAPTYVPVPAGNSTRNALVILGVIGTVLFGSCGVCGLFGVLNQPTANRPAAFVSTSPTPIPLPSSTVAATKKTPVPKQRKTPLPSPTPDQDGIYDAVTPNPAPSRRKSSSGGYITGPRGGCYYINSRGNKTYVDHSYCN